MDENKQLKEDIRKATHQSKNNKAVRPHELSTKLIK